MKSTVVVDSVALAFDLHVDTIQGKDRTRHIAQARHASYYFLRKYTRLSYPQIGKIFNCDHTSVMYGAKRVPLLCQKFPEFERRFCAASDEINRRNEERCADDGLRAVRRIL